MEMLRKTSDILKNQLDSIENLKAQYTVCSSEIREITMENGELSLFRTLFDNEVTISAIHNQKKGSTKINKFDEDALKAAVETVITSAESGTKEEYFDIAPQMEKGQFSIGVVEPDIDKLMQRTIELAEDIAKKHPKVLVMQIMVKHVKAKSLYRNTNGSEDETISGYYEVMVEFAGNDGADSTGISGSQVLIDNLDVPFIELGSIDKDLQDAEDSLKTISVEGKFEGQVIFTPVCAAQMIYYSLINFTEDTVILDKSSLWLDKIDKQVASDKISISIDPWDERIVSHEVHTADGFRSQKYAIIENGILKNYMTSLYAANKCGVNYATCSGMDLIVEGGDSSFEDMVKNMKRGLIVGAVSCGRPSANGELSGVAKNSFYVEDGEIKGAVTETMISGNLAEMLNNVVSVSKEQLADGTMVVPYICVDKMVISGK